ncbi:hypothetical protein Bbelb_048040 [Branchiostoma belcheri]|nr:hypothetical protein Bbelb_048040 [Branchiostoma belcheri]
MSGQRKKATGETSVFKVNYSQERKQTGLSGPGESKNLAETLKTGKRSPDSPKTSLEKFRVRPGMDGREQETMEGDEESGSEESGPEESSWKKKKEDEEALRFAAEEGDTGRVKQLLAGGVNPNAAGGYWQDAPLHQAAWNGHHETISVLLTAGADVNARDYRQYSPLHRAAVNGHHETVSVLLTAGADVNARDEQENTPLHDAATRGHTKCAEILLQHGADAGLRNKVSDRSFFTILDPADTLRPKGYNSAKKTQVAGVLQSAKLPKPNITKGERTALTGLRKKKDVLILPADKGKATVIMDTEDYETKGTAINKEFAPEYATKPAKPRYACWELAA